MPGVPWRAVAAYAAAAARRLALFAIAFARANLAALIFAGAMLLASIGFGLAWLPLGFIFPGVTIAGAAFAWRWRMAFGSSRDD